MSRKSIAVLVFVLVGAVFIGYIDLNADEVIVPMSFILLFSGIAGVVQPRGAWRWGLIIGLSVMLSSFFALATNFQTREPVTRFPITLAVLVIPSLVAAYAGVLIHRVIASAQGSTPRF